VANDHSQNVTVFDATTNTVVTTIDVGAGNKPQSVVVSPNGAFVYVANIRLSGAAGSVSVIATATNAVVATIATGGGPALMAMTPDGSTVYVTNFYASPPANNVFVIDTATNSVTQSIIVGSFPHGIAVTPDGAFTYVTNVFSNSVSVISTATNTVVATIPVGADPHGIGISPDGSVAYVSNYTAGTISVINIPTNTVTATITLSTAFLEGVTFSLDGSRAYVNHQHSDFVSIIDTATNTVVGTVTVGVNPWGSALEPGGRYLYTANQGSADVSVVDTLTNTVVATIPTAPGSGPENLAFATIGVTFEVCALYDQARVVKAGSTIAIKFQLCDSVGTNLSSPDIVVVAISLSHISTQVSGAIEDSGHANPDDNFRYDSSLGGSGGYIFNLSTKGLTSGMYSLSFSVSGDPSPHALTFQVR
jgi:YVTN family beta-propeller protein